MTKRLYDLLIHCKSEEEVKSEYAKYFSLRYNSEKRAEIYTEHTLFSFKYDGNLNEKNHRANAVAQALYYIRKLKFGHTPDPVPPHVCIADKSAGFFVHTSDFSKFYNAHKKYDWDRTPSQPCPVLVQAVFDSGLVDNTRVHFLEDPDDEAVFADYVYANIQKPTLFESNKKEINEANFESVYTYWASLFGKHVKDEHKPSEYFIADITEGSSHKASGTEVTFSLAGGFETKKLRMKNYDHFWSLYEKVSDSREIMSIRQKIDRLSEEKARRRKGEFYTPIDFAEKAFEYIERTVGTQKYKSGNWRIWDMAAGTGNLEYPLPGSVIENCYISTLEEDDTAYCKRIFPNAAAVFQYDYLNDDAYRIEAPDSTPLAVTPKLPKNLIEDLQNPDISWIIFINPPFATSNNMGEKVGKESKDDVSKTCIREIMTERNLGETSRELFSQFLYRISVEFKGKSAYLGLFSTLKYINSNNDQKLRDYIFRYKFERGFMFSSKCFQGGKGEFPVGFLVWNLNKEISLEEQNIVLDVYDTNCEKIGTKQIPSQERNNFLSNWAVRCKNTKTFPAFSSAFSIGNREKDVRDRIADDFICSLMCNGNDMQHQNQTSILSGPYASAGGYSVVPQNFERSMITHAVRKLRKADWTNNRDQFYQPYSDRLPAEFVSDCVIWSAFAPSNNTVALKDVEYKGEIYQIENRMFPFLLSEVSLWKCPVSHIRDGLLCSTEDRFLAKWISSSSLSEEARELMQSAKELYKHVYENLTHVDTLDCRIASWDMGWAQIRKALGQLDKAAPLHAEFKKNFKALSVKLGASLSSLGFLPPDVRPLD